MALTLTSTNPNIDKPLKDIAKDNITTPAEFMIIRDTADKVLLDLANPATLEVVKSLQKEMDDVVESMQKVALVARKNKLTPEERQALMFGVEAQVAYLILGYKSSIERLNTFNHK
ncbi:hypothetical protein [Ewingella americana]|jgi:hypothetical protein|uniref:Uncharacterized protein n=1 Tax=Ewingella americana TaxID=41202 RepID=A0A502GPV0_9GAMM|nr:hypothetical protein [Ewingella americana]TPG63448.1 hypothetical protein EAH77_07755 [Ewingella americana]